MKQTFNQTRKWITDYKEMSNKGELAIYNHFVQIKKLGVWKQPSYYDNDKPYKKYSRLSFNRFLKAAFGFSASWFTKVSRILAEKNGEELFLKYGRKNMSFYIKRSVKEKKELIRDAEKSYHTKSFYELWKSRYPDRIRKRIDYRKKFFDLEKRYEEIEKELYGLRRKLFEIDKLTGR